MATELFDCNDLTKFIGTIKEVLPFEGYSTSRFYSCEYNGVPFFVKLAFYRKSPFELYGSGTQTTAQIDVEIGILEKLREMITQPRVSPCILELVNYVKCEDIDRIAFDRSICKQIVTNKKPTNPKNDVEQTFCRYKGMVEANLAHNKCVFLVLERCDVNLGSFIFQTLPTPMGMVMIKSLLFMILYTLYAINTIWPGFRHRDLHPGNIMIKYDPNFVYDPSRPKFLSVNVRGSRFLVPYFGIIPKIIDFGFSSLPEYNYISNITEDKFTMYHKIDNDILFLFLWLNSDIETMTNPNSRKLAQLLEELEPGKLFKKYFLATYIREVESMVPTYGEMMDNPVWNEYKEYKVSEEQIHSSYSF